MEDAKGYDKVIVATGGTPNHTELPTTSDAIPVYTSRQVLSGEIMAGKNVVVIGGSYIGCFTAQYLAREGAMSPDELFFSMTHNSDTMEHILSRLNHSDRSVVLLEKGKKIGLGFESGTSWPVLGELGRLGGTVPQKHAGHRHYRLRRGRHRDEEGRLPGFPSL